MSCIVQITFYSKLRVLYLLERKSKYPFVVANQVKKYGSARSLSFWSLFSRIVTILMLKMVRPLSGLYYGRRKSYSTSLFFMFVHDNGSYYKI